MINSIFKIVFALNLLISPFYISAQTSFPANDDNIHYMGRVDFSNPEQPTYIYPGTSIKAKFNGTEITAIIHDYGNGTDEGGNFYKIFIDGQIVTEQLKVSSGEASYLLASGLTVNDHIIEIMKITEGASGKSSFLGFIISGGLETLQKFDSAPQKRIEFIGDSWTCGFGNLSQFVSGQASMVYSNYQASNEDNYYAWGPICARAIGAQYHVIATSGRGLYRNNTGSMTNTLPKNYDNILEDDATYSWNHSNYHSDVISIHLGTNDLAQEEEGQLYKLDDEAFKQTYIDFITKLLSIHPCSNIIICFGNSKSDSWPTWTQQLSRLRNISHDVASNFNENVTTLELPFTAEKWTGDLTDDCGYGDAWHPSKCSHEEMGSKLIEKINTMNINWGDTSCLLSANELTSNEFRLFYPNPVEKKLIVKNIMPNTNWFIYNALGQNKLSGFGNIIDVSSLQRGIYFLKTINMSKSQSITFVKK